MSKWSEEFEKTYKDTDTIRRYNKEIKDQKELEKRLKQASDNISKICADKRPIKRRKRWLKSW